MAMDLFWSGLDSHLAPLIPLGSPTFSLKQYLDYVLLLNGLSFTVGEVTVFPVEETASPTPPVSSTSAPDSSLKPAPVPGSSHKSVPLREIHQSIPVREIL